MQVRGFIVGLVIGVLVTAGLFLLMQQLIKSDKTPPPPPQSEDGVDFIRDKAPPVKPRTREHPKRPPDDKPPPPPRPPRETPGRKNDDGFNPPNPPPPTVGPGDVPTLDSEPQPILRVEPPYPITELRREREGDVTVEFTITEDGTVTGIRVVSATSEAFARSVVRAVAQWRYAPKMVGGKPMARTGVRVTLTFRISEED